MCTIKLGKTIILTDNTDVFDDIPIEERDKASHIIHIDTKTDTLTCFKTKTSKLKGIWKKKYENTLISNK